MFYIIIFINDPVTQEYISTVTWLNRIIIHARIKIRFITYNFEIRSIFTSDVLYKDNINRKIS